MPNNTASTITRTAGLLLLTTPDAFARGGRGSKTGLGIILGVAALVAVWWLLSQPSTSTWRALGGLVLLFAAGTFLIQFLGLLFR